ncbi:MAG: cysteine desulfurase family protein [Acidimicrobiia bacterium]
MIYLDHAATTPMRPEVWEAMAPYATDVFGNASGSHGVARRAKNALEVARERAAAVLGALPSEIVFTSGGTESDNLAVKGRAVGGAAVVTTSIEHEAVLEAADHCARLGSPVRTIAPDRFGRVSPDEVVDAISPDTGVVSVMAANNETGMVQPVAEIVGAVAGRVPVHTDAVQAFATLDVRVDDLGVDLLSLSAHKFGGPKGIGLLYVRQGVALEAVLHGGGQELGRRSGTSNVMGAVGMALAMELAAADRPRIRRDVGAARDAFVASIRHAGVGTPTVDLDRALVSHAHIRFPGVRNETLLIRLDRLGVAVSVGSACASGAATVSHVLTAMGVSADVARESLRFSFGWTSTVDDGDVAARLVLEALAGLR